MNATDLKNRISSLLDDVVFDYQGERACINPWSSSKFEVGYGDKVKTYTDIDTLMTDKFFKGMALKDIAPQLAIL